jgi:hypothetical protein
MTDQHLTPWTITEDDQEQLFTANPGCLPDPHPSRQTARNDS